MNLQCVLWEKYVFFAYWMGCSIIRLKWFKVQLRLLLSPDSVAHHTTGQWIGGRIVGERNSDFIWKSSRLRCQTTVSKKHLTPVRFQKGQVVAVCCKLLDAGVLCSCRCLCRLSLCSCKPPTRQMSFSARKLLICVYAWTLKYQSPENGLSCVFQAIGNILLEKVQSQRDSVQATENKV